ncbi:TnsA endonuclease N-terminal domain-containing protein [Aliarcobacter skirrowii]|uniref:TnsA endonuclease N-terminal domain-containing protein n=1 Tax=Aliarcobacter skirrowii TaxID=28200 RepID=UPI000834EBC1|nr:TnsA endonuclease N-terminal domain-containing protein [Aliarcobacter skirrowii]
MYDDAITFGQRQIKKSYRSVTGHFPSVKNNRSIGFDSSLEKTLFLYLEFDDTVETYQEQPRIMILKNGKPQKYDVDCFVKRYKKSNLKDALIEVKYLSEFEKNKDIYEKKFNAAKIRSDEIGVDFKFLTELNFNDIYISNIDFLYRFILHPFEDKYDNIILDSLKDKKISALELANLIMKSQSEYQRVSNNIWKLVAQNILKTDLENEKVTMKSIVEINNGSN